MLDSILMAFSLYSRIPVPGPKWNEKNMRYCICFLPLVGAVIGGAQGLAFYLLTRFSFGTIFRAAILTALPVLLSGGIHLDGYLDTCDAIHSYKGKEERLEILKDPHVGAFAVLGGFVWFILDFGIWSEAGARTMPLLCLSLVLSRALSALAALIFPKAKRDGMLHSETAPAANSAPGLMALLSALIGMVMILLRPAEGAAAVFTAFAVLIYYRYMSDRYFGGITGDLSGWFTQVCELAAAAAIVVTGRFF